MSHLQSSNGKNVSPTVFKRQKCLTYCLQMAKLSHLLSSNGKTAKTYCLQTVKPSTPTVIKRSNSQHLLSSNGKTVTSNLYKWQNRPHDKNVTTTFFKRQNCHTCSLQTAKPPTPTVFKRRNR